MYTCCSTEDEITSADRLDEEMSYVYIGGGIIDHKVKHRRIVAYDKPGNHEGGSNVAFLHGPNGAGYVEWVSEHKLTELLRAQGTLLEADEQLVDSLAALAAELVAKANAGDSLYFQNLMGGADKEQAAKLMEMIKKSGMETNCRERFTEDPVGIGHLNYHDLERGCHFQMKLSPTEGRWAVDKVSFCR